MSHGVPRYFTCVADRWLRKSSFDYVAHRPHEFDLAWVVIHPYVVVFISISLGLELVLFVVTLSPSIWSLLYETQGVLSVSRCLEGGRVTFATHLGAFSKVEGRECGGRCLEYVEGFRVSPRSNRLPRLRAPVFRFPDQPFTQSPYSPPPSAAAHQIFWPQGLPLYRLTCLTAKL